MLSGVYSQAEEGPTSSFENVFPSEKLKNGYVRTALAHDHTRVCMHRWSVALRFMSVGYDKIKQSTIEGGCEYVRASLFSPWIIGVEYVNNTQAMGAIRQQVHVHSIPRPFTP
jgi:hypothetical protein